MDAFHAELLACFAGLQVAVKLGIQEIDIETDATLIKEALTGDGYRLSAVGV
jgi:ribonuclease HI